MKTNLKEWRENRILSPKDYNKILNKKIQIETIINVTGLTKEEIEQL